MKFLLPFTLAFLSFLLVAPLQAQKCDRPVSSAEFKVYHSQIKAQRQETTKMSMAKEMLQKHCFASEQLRDVVKLITNEYSKFDLASFAYSHIFDPHNFYEVYDGFTSFSNVMRLHDAIGTIPQAGQGYSSHPNTGGHNTGQNSGHTGGTTTININTTPNPTTAPVVVPEPTVEIDEYANCRVDASGMEEIKAAIDKQSFNNTKMTTLKEITKSRCFSAEQIKVLCELFSFDNSRLEYAKFAYKYCTDQKNYFKVNEVFDHSFSVTELTDYIAE